MCKAEKVTDFMGRFLHKAIKEIFITGGLTVKFTVQPGSGHDGIPCGVSGESEEVFIT